MKAIIENRIINFGRNETANKKITDEFMDILNRVLLSENLFDLKLILKGISYNNFDYGFEETYFWVSNMINNERVIFVEI